MGTRQLALEGGPLRVRVARGTTAVAALPGTAPALAPTSPTSPSDPAEPADEPPTAVEQRGQSGPAQEQSSAGPAPAAAVLGLTPVPLTPVPAVPAKPTEPPAVPPLPTAAPALPAVPSPPAFEPLFKEAPALNWVGPDDRWSRAWGLPAGGRAVAELEPVGAPAEEAGPPQPPSAEDLVLIRAVLAAVQPHADRAMAHFHALMFLRHPELRAMFPAAMDEPRERLFRALRRCAGHGDDPAALREYLVPLGRRQRKYGALTRHYASVEDCLVAALARYGGSGWDERTEAAWRRLLALASRLMVEGAEQEARSTPPWWQAEVVAHRQAVPGVAVLTLRPDQAYPFRAGQWAALETPWWPRVWRPYSFGSAPRPDGLLTLHVKAVQAGWVSNALVHRARPGDVLRLGAAEGAMTVDHAAGENLLCLGGGTGIGPIAALVEEVAEHGAAGRRVEVFYGARRAAELYRLDELRELAARHSWLTVRPVLSEQSSASGGELLGELPEVVTRYAPWHGFTACLSGPAGMVRGGVAALRRSGVPDASIRHDLPRQRD
ncbi:globin domain-containing protein [Streptomyces sp. TLI_171]|uniref:globin domain-containing protein n=1 Tax=Streptomyces sp. TLI_171 TaxID=1938859 RepID=UPI00117EAB5F|nr:globin domain-containing protein [Streptomyces sp. TLI_171]